MSIEQYENLVELLKQALKFYANPSNYNGAMGTIAPIDSDEYGSQARFALSKIDEINQINKKLENDLINSIDDVSNESTENMMNIIKLYKNIDNDV